MAEVAAALGAGLLAGVFFAFSGFVLAALDRAAPEAGADWERYRRDTNESYLLVAMSPKR